MIPGEPGQLSTIGAQPWRRVKIISLHEHGTVIIARLHADAHNGIYGLRILPSMIFADTDDAASCTIHAAIRVTNITARRECCRGRLPLLAVESLIGKV